MTSPVAEAASVHFAPQAQRKSDFRGTNGRGVAGVVIQQLLVVFVVIWGTASIWVSHSEQKKETEKESSLRECPRR